MTDRERLDAIAEVLNYMGFSSIDELLNDDIPSLRRYLSRLPELHDIERTIASGGVEVEPTTNLFMNRRICSKKPETSMIPEIINPILGRKYRGLE